MPPRAQRRATAFRDGLTRLPTRSTFEGTLSQVLTQADAHQTQAVLMHVALDRFRRSTTSSATRPATRCCSRVAQRLRELGPAAPGGATGGRRIPGAGRRPGRRPTAPRRWRPRCWKRSPSLRRRQPGVQRRLLHRHGQLPAAWRAVRADLLMPRWPRARPRPRRRHLLGVRPAHGGRRARPGRTAGRPAAGAVARPARAVLPAEDPRAERAGDRRPRPCCAGTTRGAA